tara:strand:- start:1644 stop:3230 length:1587 start_codon:yes stop_codon:yes gene_type:complete
VVGYADLSNEVWVGAGASVTMIPETNIFLGASCTVSGAVLTLGTLPFELVTNLYTGCTVEMTGSSNTQRLVVKSNTKNTITFSEGIASSVGTSSVSATLLPFGSPSPAIHSTASVANKPSLLADNWLGLINTFSPPNIDVEIAQMNLSLAGTRNLQYQYKKGETVSGGSLDLSMSHGGWLYYVLGRISSVSSTAGSAAAASSGGKLLTVADDSTKFYKALGNTATAYPPTNTAITGLKLVTDAHIHYTFAESNGQDLPSFALEVTYEKEGIDNSHYYVGSNNRLTAEESDGSNDDTVTNFETSHTEIYSRVFTGCQVNSTTISFDEGQEVKQTLDLVTRSAFDVPNGYVPKRKIREPKNLHNYSGDATLVLDAEDRRPYLFSEGSITLFGNTVARVKSGSITISNNITPQRYIGNYTRGITSAHIPAARTYEVSLNMLVTDTDLWNDLRAEQGENLEAATKIEVKFTKTGGYASADDFFSITLQDFITQSVDIPFPEDKGPVEIAATFSARTLAGCEYSGKWVILNND